MADNSYEEEFLHVGTYAEEGLNFKDDTQQYHEGLHGGIDSEKVKRLKHEIWDYPQSLHDGKDSEMVQRLKDEIENYKDKYNSLLCDIRTLQKEKQEYDSLTSKCQSKMDQLQSKILVNKLALDQEEKTFEEKSKLLKDEYLELTEQVKDIKEQIDDYERNTIKLEKFCSTVVERKMVFKGNIANGSSGLSIKHQITYPLNGGSALITFKEQSVAAEVISDKCHKIDIEDYRIYVKAQPVELLVLDTLSVNMDLSLTKILVYNLPHKLPKGQIMDKLELYFSKSKNGGGEVDKAEYLSDCRCAIITFVNNSVASRLVEMKSFLVPFENSSHQVFVAPSLNGNLEKYQMKTIKCDRTVLLTGIPDITDKDNLQDLLELHFHKISNDGVHALMYCQEGESAMAFFENDQDDMSDTE